MYLNMHERVKVCGTYFDPGSKNLFNILKNSNLHGLFLNYGSLDCVLTHCTTDNNGLVGNSQLGHYLLIRI